MKRLTVPALLLLTAVPPLKGQAVRPTPDAMAEAVDQCVTRAYALGGAPALGVALIMDGRLILNRNLGMADQTRGIPADDRTLWYVASTSKSFTGFALSLLAARGRISLDAPIASLLAEARWADGVDPNALTLAHFLSHRSGLDGRGIVVSTAFTGAIPEADLPRWLLLNQPTGSPDLVYSNLGYEVGAMVLNRLEPRGWRTLQQRELFAPAGMREIYTRVSGLDRRRFAMPHDVGPDGAFVTDVFHKADATMAAAGGHLATLDALARWVIVQCDSGRIDGRQVFPVEATRVSHTMLAPQTRDQAKRFAMFVRDGWSPGWDIGSYEGERMVSRFGSFSSTRSHLSFLPQRRIGVVAMATGGMGSELTDIIAAYVYDLEAGRPTALRQANERLETVASRLGPMRQSAATGDSTRRARQLVPLAHPLQAFVGRYTLPGYGTIVWSLGDGRLHFQWGDEGGPAEIFDGPRSASRRVRRQWKCREFHVRRRRPFHLPAVDGAHLSPGGVTGAVLGDGSGSSQ